MKRCGGFPAKKPTVAVVGTLAASGGYIAALGADGIVAQGNSLVGSIGVLVEYPNFAKLLDTIGVKVEDVKSSPLKAAPNGFEPTTPEARAALASIVDDSYAWFKDLVKQRRALNDPQLAAVDDGRVFTGRQGIGLHLVDRLGGEREAIAWLQKKKSVPKGLKVRDWKASSSVARLGLFSLAAHGAAFFRLDGLSALLEQGEHSPRLPFLTVLSRFGRLTAQIDRPEHARRRGRRIASRLCDKTKS